MRMHLIAQPCAIMIRGLPTRLDRLCPDSHPRVHLPLDSQTLTASRHLVPSNPHPWAALNIPTRRAWRCLFSSARYRREPVSRECETPHTGARSSSSIAIHAYHPTWQPWLCCPYSYITDSHTLASPAGLELLACSHLASSHDYMPPARMLFLLWIRYYM